MKQIIKTICFMALPFMLKGQNALVNNGSIIKINSGGSIHVNGSMLNENSSNLNVDGELAVTGDLTNNQFMNGPAAGTIKFNGTSAQTVQGTQELRVNNLEINNNAGITLNQKVLVLGESKFIDGIVTANAYQYALAYGPTGSVSITNPPGNSSHVNGYVQKYGTGIFDYPVGDGTQYQKISTNLSANTSAMVVRYNAGNAGAGNYTNAGTEATPLVAYNTAEYWDVMPFGSATGTVTVYWDAYNNAGITDIALLKTARKSGADWLNEGTAGIGSVANGSVTSNTLTNWSLFALGSINPPVPLPVTMLSFTGKKSAHGNYLQWLTASEQNNKHFILQRSSNAIQFENIATINSKAPQGNSNSELAYDFTDKNPHHEITYYRLQQADMDGNVHYSNIIKLSNEAMQNVINGYPNPVQNTLVVESKLKNDILLLNATGQVILKKAMQEHGNSFKTTLDFSNLANGIYFIKSGNEVLKVMK